MGHKHTRDQILAGALAAAVDDGLSRLTFGRLAHRLGVSDRVVVYYFPTKDDLITGVLGAMGTQLQVVLADAFSSPASGYLELVKAAWPALARPEIDPTFRLLFEANGLAVAGREPYQALAGQLTEGWIASLSDFLEGPPDQCRGEAETAVAMLDGLLLLRLLAGPAAAERAAVRLGVAGAVRQGHKPARDGTDPGTKKPD